MDEIIQQLTDIGLVKNDAYIYCILLQFNSKTIMELSEISTLSRPSVYKIINSLLKAKLIFIDGSQKRPKYIAYQPDVIFNVLRQRQEQFFKLLPLLRNLSNVPRGTISGL